MAQAQKSSSKLPESVIDTDGNSSKENSPTKAPPKTEGGVDVVKEEAGVKEEEGEIKKEEEDGEEKKDAEKEHSGVCLFMEFVDHTRWT